MPARRPAFFSVSWAFGSSSRAAGIPTTLPRMCGEGGMRNGSGSVRRGGTSSNETGNRPARRLSPQSGRGSLHALSASRRREWLFRLNVLPAFLAGGVVCHLLTVVATIVALTLFWGPRCRRPPARGAAGGGRSRSHGGWRRGVCLPSLRRGRRCQRRGRVTLPGLRRARRCSRAGLVVCSACRRASPRGGKMRRRGRAGRPPAASATRPERPIRGERWIP